MAGGLTTEEVIKRARGHFGEETALTVQDTVLREWVNDAIKDLYDQLPPTELDGLISVDSLSLTSGSAEIDTSWDRVIDVLGPDSVPLHPVNPEVVRAIDLGTFWEPTQTVYALTQTHVLVRPDSTTEVQISHMEPPALITQSDTGQDIETVTNVNARWHNALVIRLAYFMYGQEEDWNSAQSHLATWQSLIEGAWQQSGRFTSAESVAEARRYGVAAQSQE